MSGPHAILYDADCGFCRWALNKVLAWDRRRRLRPVAIQSDEGQKLLSELPADRRLESWHLVAPDGAVRSAGSALAPLARQLRGGGPLAFLFDRFPRASERGYRWIADNRGRWARLLHTGCPELRRA